MRTSLCTSNGGVVGCKIVRNAESRNLSRVLESAKRYKADGIPLIVITHSVEKRAQAALASLGATLVIYDEDEPGPLSDSLEKALAAIA